MAVRLPLNYYEIAFGTSASTALVSGIAASLISVQPALWDVDIKNILRVTAADIYGLGRNDCTGSGRADHGAAVATVDPSPSGNNVLIGGSAGPRAFPFPPEQKTLTIIGHDDETLNGTWVANRFEARFQVAFPSPPAPFQGTPDAWVHVVGTNGWSPDLQHRFDYGWGEVVPGTLNENEAAFRTYVYFIPQLNRWVPTDTSHVKLKYAAIGRVGSLVGVTMVPEGTGLRVQLASNPVPRGRGVTLAVKGAGSTPVSVEVYDVRGRRLLRWGQKPDSEGRVVLRWAGTAEDGCILSPGMYLLRVRQGGTVQEVKVVLLP